MSALNYENYGSSKFCYMPKVGSEIEVHIKEIREIKVGLDKFHFTKMEEVKGSDGNSVMVNGVPLKAPHNLGYHVEAELVDGKVLSITSLAAFIQVFVKNKLQDGDKVKIFHRAKGEWEVTKL